MTRSRMSSPVPILWLLAFAAMTAVPPRAAEAGTLAGYWAFDGNSADSSSNGRDLILFGGVGFAPGLFGRAPDLHHDNSQYAARPVTDPSR